MIEDIQRKVREELFELSVHALTRSMQRHIILDELVEAILNGEVIEIYPFNMDQVV